MYLRQCICIIQTCAHCSKFISSFVFVHARLSARSRSDPTSELHSYSTTLPRPATLGRLHPSGYTRLYVRLMFPKGQQWRRKGAARKTENDVPYFIIMQSALYPAAWTIFSFCMANLAGRLQLPRTEMPIHSLLQRERSNREKDRGRYPMTDPSLSLA